MDLSRDASIRPPADRAAAFAATSCPAWASGTAHLRPTASERCSNLRGRCADPSVRAVAGVSPPSPTTTVDPVIILFGLGVGILVGLTGVGGGSLMTPLLLIVGGYSPVVAIGTDLAYGAITKTVGGWRHLRAGHVDLRLSWWLAAGSVPGSLLGVLAVNRLARDLRRRLRALPPRARRGRAHAGVRGDALPGDVPPRPGRRRAALGAAGGAHQQGRDGRRRRPARLHPRDDLRGLRRADRARADPALPAQPAPRRRHGRVPRGRAPVDGRPRALGERERGSRAHGDHPHRVAPRRLDRDGASPRTSPSRACATASASCSPPRPSACSPRRA